LGLVKADLWRLLLASYGLKMPSNGRHSRFDRLHSLRNARNFHRNGRKSARNGRNCHRN
jgi:hypothetical protein